MVFDFDSCIRCVLISEKLNKYINLISDPKSEPISLSLPQSSSLNSLINLKHKTAVNNSTIQKT